MDGGEESKTFTVLAPQCMLVGSGKDRRPPRLVYIRDKDEPGRSVPFRIERQNGDPSCSCSSAVPKGLVIVRRRRHPLSSLLSRLFKENRGWKPYTEKGNNHRDQKMKNQVVGNTGPVFSAERPTSVVRIFIQHTLFTGISEIGPLPYRGSQDI